MAIAIINTYKIPDHESLRLHSQRGHTEITSDSLVKKERESRFN